MLSAAQIRNPTPPEILTGKTVAIELPADMDAHHLADLIKATNHRAQLRIYLPDNTPMEALHEFSKCAGLCIANINGINRISRPSKPSIFERARNFITQPQPF